MTARLMGVTDLYMTGNPEPAALQAAAARAVGVPLTQVVLATFRDPKAYSPDLQVWLQLRADDVPGDVPVRYAQAVMPSLADRVGEANRLMAMSLGLTIVSDDDDAADPVIYLPDGSIVQRPLVPIEEDGYRLPSDLLRHPGAPTRTRRAA
ncbi:MAG: hypothetical protein ACTHMX_11010 [Thermomicrobiales bacterium]